MDDLLTDSIIAHQGEAERMFAGAVMIDPRYARETCGWLQPSMIHDDKIGAWWAKVQGGADPAETAIEGKAYGEFVGYMTKVNSVFDMRGFANAISTDHYLIACGRTMGSMAQAITDGDLDGLRAKAQSIADNSPAAGDEIPNAVDIGIEFQVMLDNMAGRSELTGIGALDKATGGLEKQTMTVIAARPSMGKSALGIQICKWKAENEDKRILLFSLEMNRKSIFARMACGELKLAWRDVRAGRVTPERIQKLKDKASELMERLGDKLLIDDTANMSAEDIWRKVSRYKPDFVVVDHMGLVSSRETNEVLALGQISREHKIMAKQFDIPVVVLYQLNRGTEKRDNKRPTMADIRGSGKIEENADNIFFLYRPDYYEDAKPTQIPVSKSEVVIAKFRDGIRNIQVNLQYHLDEQWFYDEQVSQYPTERR